MRSSRRRAIRGRTAGVRSAAAEFSRPYSRAVCNVASCGRSQEGLDSAAAEFSRPYSRAVCNVASSGKGVTVEMSVRISPPSDWLNAEVRELGCPAATIEDEALDQVVDQIGRAH